MAVRILTPGKPKADDVYRGVCGSCRCIIECQQSDMKHDNDPRDGGYFLPCPTPRCGGHIYPKIVPGCAR